MRRPNLYATVLLLTCLLALLTACTERPPVQPDDSDEVAALAVNPSEGPPGALVEVTGLSLEVALAEGLMVYVGDEPTVAGVREDGTLLAAIPLYLNDTDWPAPPVEAQSLSVRREDGEVVGEAKDALRVTALPEAPGAAEAVADATAEIVHSLETVFATLSMESEVMAQHRYALFAALHEFTETGEDSLRAVIEGTAPILEGEEARLELTDALLASSGVLEATQELEAAIRDFADASELRPQALLCDIAMGDQSEDLDLACKMQLYVVVKDFGETVVRDTAKTYAETVGVTSGLISIGGKVPLASIIGATLSIANFVINKYVVALLPAKIESFDLEFPTDFEESVMRQGEILPGIVTITAVNDPPSIGLNDVVSLTLTAMGFIKINKGNDELRSYLLKTARYFLGLYAKGFAAYSDAHPELNLNPELSEVPDITWGPTEIEEFKLVQLHSFQPELLKASEERLEWTASEDEHGDARVEVRTAGQEGKVINYSGYTGGAFGNEQTATETKTVCIDTPPELLSVTVSPETIAADAEVNQSYTLTYEDECANLETIRNEVRLLPQNLGDIQEVGVDAAFVSGFTEKEGEGYWVANVFVSCDYSNGLLQGSKRNGFTLEDGFAQASETLYTYTTVDYSGCED